MACGISQSSSNYLALVFFRMVPCLGEGSFLLYNNIIVVKACTQDMSEVYLVPPFTP